MKTNWDTDEDAPGPRCGHTLTAVAATKSHGPRLILFGGATAIEGGPAGHSTDDLYVLDLINDKFKWHRVVVQDPGPGPRCAHSMDLVAQRYLVTVSGNDGKRVLSDAWALDTAQKPYKYATASARSDDMFFLCGGRDASGTPLSDAYGLFMHRNGQWEWTLAPGVSPSPRYQHSAGGRAIDGEASIAVLDTAAGVWLDRNGVVTSSRANKGVADFDAAVELMRRCRHASASVGVRIYIFAGLRGDQLLDDLLIAENSPFQSDINTPISISERPSTPRMPKLVHLLQVRIQQILIAELPARQILIADQQALLLLAQKSVDKLVEASAASTVWQAAKAASSVPTEEASTSDGNNVHIPEVMSDGSDTEGDVRLFSRAVVVAKETVGNLGGLVRQLSLDQFENESRRVNPLNNDQEYTNKKFLARQRSPQGLHKKIISLFLRPRNWKGPANRRFFLDSYEVGELCYAAEQIFMPLLGLAGVTNSVHCYDVLTRKWTRMKSAGEPSTRAAHVAAAVGSMVVFQGGMGPAGHLIDDMTRLICSIIVVTINA
ncbi:hypothetical protein C5167_035751 [Papaver somniferum]|nr:hypothetical protein C5167_035751 [Papaver somniferum]